MNDSHIERLFSLKGELEQMSVEPWANIESWIAKATPVIRTDWSDFIGDFQEVVAEPRWTALPRISGNEAFNRRARADEQMCNRAIAENAKRRMLNFLDGLLATSQPIEKGTALDTVLFLCRRFQIFVRQLATRMRGRQPIEFRDEYDVQYLLLALLRLHFEECAPKSGLHPVLAAVRSWISF